jgi:toxin ParE1/3/4
MSLRLLPEADEEAREAARWYDQQRIGLGDEFLEALARSLESIERNPRLGRVDPDAPAGREVRRIRLNRFPYIVIYEIRNGDILVVAIAHGRRRPGYWLSRNGN